MFTLAADTAGADSAAHAVPEVPMGITILFCVVLAGLIACLALEEKIHAKKSVIAGVFAVLSLLLGAFLLELPFGKILLPNGHPIKLPVFIPAIEWNVITIILGSSIFVDVTSKSGLFTWIAIKLTKLSKGDPLILLIFYSIMTVVFSAVLNNVTAMIIVGSLSAVSLSKLERSDKLLAFLLIEGLLTNVGGLLTLISSVPNIIVGTTARIEFMDFFFKAVIYVVLATVITVAMGAKIFKIGRLSTFEEKQRAAEQVAGFDENDGIESKGFFWFGAIMLLLFIGMIAGASIDNWPIADLGMGFVAMAFGIIMLVRFKATANRFYSAIDWDLLFFFVFLFVTIYMMEHAMVLDLIGKGVKPIIGLGDKVGAGLMLATSAFASSVTDNIPLAAMLAKIMVVDPTVVPDPKAGNPDSPFWWSVIFGANLGGNLTPIGSASTLVAVTIMHKYDLKMTFMGFVKMALPFAIAQIVLAIIYVLVVIPLL